MIITISRENGSGGKYIAERLSEMLNIPLYDKELVAEAAKTGKISLDDAVKNDETSSGSYMEGKSLYKGFFSKMTLDDELFELESEVIRSLAKKGDCIIVGRCSNYILKDEDTIDVFLYASDMGFKIARKVEYNGLDRKTAEKQIKEKDRSRAVYHEYHTGHSWEEKTDYDLCMDTGKIGMETAVDLIAFYYRAKKEAKGNAEK